MRDSYQCRLRAFVHDDVEQVADPTLHKGNIPPIPIPSRAHNLQIKHSVDKNNNSIQYLDKLFALLIELVVAEARVQVVAG